MKHNLMKMSRQYVTALRRHLEQGPGASLQPARGLGRQAVAMGLGTLDVARIHEGARASLEASASRDGISKRAEKSNRQNASIGGTIRSFNQSIRP